METKVCLVTGGSRGIGRGIAIELASNGYTVYITGRDVKTLTEVVTEAECFSGKILRIRCDHSIDDDVDKLFQKIENNGSGRLDLLVNCAYSAAEFITENSEKPFWDLPPNAWDEFNNVGLRNNYRCSVLAARLMVKRRKGLIINISSVGGSAYLLTPAYGIGKCAKDRMALDCASDLRKYNVAFISLRPCAVKTEYFLKMVTSEESSMSKSKESKFFAENGESPRFVGKAVSFLLQDSNIMSKSGRSIFTADLAREYGFSDDGTTPADFRCVKDMLAASGFNVLSKFVPACIRIPLWLLCIMLNKLAPPKMDSIHG